MSTLLQNECITQWRILTICDDKKQEKGRRKLLFHKREKEK